MKLFVDSANLAEIEESLARGFVAGITTNPSILAKEERTDFTEHIHKIIGLIRRYGREVPLSVEVFVDDPAEMLDQALKFVSAFRYPMLSVTVPPQFFPALTQHPKTTEAVDQFLGDFRKWSEQA